MIRVAFPITVRLYSSDSGVWGEPVILMARCVIRESLVLCLVVRELYRDEMLKVRMGSMSDW